MATMTHTPEQRRAWHAAKRTGKQRRAEERKRAEAMLRSEDAEYRYIRANAGSSLLEEDSRLRRQLGDAAGRLWLLSFGRVVARLAEDDRAARRNLPADEPEALDERDEVAA